MPNHYLKQWWLTVNCIPRSKLKGNKSQTIDILKWFLQYDILFSTPCVKISWNSINHLRYHNFSSNDCHLISTKTLFKNDQKGSIIPSLGIIWDHITSTLNNTFHWYQNELTNIFFSSNLNVLWDFIIFSSAILNAIWFTEGCFNHK